MAASRASARPTPRWGSSCAPKLAQCCILYAQADSLHPLCCSDQQGQLGHLYGVGRRHHKRVARRRLQCDALFTPVDRLYCASADLAPYARLLAILADGFSAGANPLVASSSSTGAAVYWTCYLPALAGGELPIPLGSEVKVRQPSHDGALYPKVADLQLARNVLTDQDNYLCRRDARALPGLHAPCDAERAQGVQLSRPHGDPAASLPRRPAAQTQDTQVGPISHDPGFRPAADTYTARPSGSTRHTSAQRLRI
jgi:hypothetical protein